MPKRRGGGGLHRRAPEVRVRRGVLHRDDRMRDARGVRGADPEERRRGAAGEGPGRGERVYEGGDPAALRDVSAAPARAVWVGVLPVGRSSKSLSR